MPDIQSTYLEKCDRICVNKVCVIQALAFNMQRCREALDKTLINEPKLIDSTFPSYKPQMPSILEEAQQAAPETNSL